jgi:anaerobic magnesium-protoporphyrin IX monomethyl ester cyclase
MKQGKVLLIGAEDEENLAIRYLGGVLNKNGYEVKISPFSKIQDIKKVLKDIKRFNPDLIGISIAFQSLAKMFFLLIKEIKKIYPDIHITVGGHFPTFEYEEILKNIPEIDSIIRFEGEKPIVSLIETIKKQETIDKDKDFSKVPNLVYRNNGKISENQCKHEFPNLNILPYPIRTNKPQVRLGENFATLIASRGCFHSSCLYCCIGAFHSKKTGCKYALRSPESIADEIADLYYKKNIRLFQFHDDNFMLPDKQDTLKRFIEIKHAIQNKGINLNNIAFLIKARPDSINKEIGEILKQLGVVGVFLGVENATDSGLKSLIRGSSLKDIKNAINILKQNGISVTFNLLIFHPNATLKEIKENIDFISEYKDNALDFGRAEIVAGSPLERLVKKENLLQGEWPNWDYKIKDKQVNEMFIMNKETFRKKNSSYSRVAHHLIALIYHSYVVNRIYPGISSSNLQMRVNKLIKYFNEYLIKKLREIYELTKNNKRFENKEEFNKDLDMICMRTIKESKKLSKKLERLQLIEKKFKLMGLNESPQNNKIIRNILNIP